MAPIKRIRIGSLLQILNDVIIAGNSHGRRSITVASLRPRDVTSMLLVVKMAKETVYRDRRWKITNSERLRRMEQAVHLLEILEAALLPALTTFPDSADLLAALQGYAITFCDNARAAGGTFSTRAETLRAHLLDFASMAAAELVPASEEQGGEEQEGDEPGGEEPEDDEPGGEEHEEEGPAQLRRLLDSLIDEVTALLDGDATVAQ